jgi:hypothetical protein
MIAIRGVVHHLLGPLAPSQRSPHQFAQLYIIDNADAQATARFAALGQGNVDLDRRTLQELQQMLLGNNGYVQRFVQAMDLPFKTWLNMRLSSVLMATLTAAATTPPHPARWPA